MSLFQDFIDQNGGLDWSLVAEMAFETEAASYEITDCETPYRSYTKAGEEVEKDYRTGFERVLSGGGSA